ncbi:MAG: hypothetical protein PVI86_00960 [Phycisphaerae bacterium]|jgi:hypothetical protein
MNTLTCRCRRCVLVAAVCLGATVYARTSDEPGLTAPASRDEMVSLINDLSHPSYERRLFATRRLCTVGASAREELQAGAESDDIERVLRCKAILNVLDRLMFNGVDLTLAFAKTKIAWDEPTDLHITMLNQTKYPTRVPFEIERSDDAKPGDDARQVGDMLDVGDLVHVYGDAGLDLDLTVDDIRDSPDVVAAVQRRLDGGPASVLAPGERVTFIVRAFNRGWARYRLLDKGTYTVKLEYVPRWNDEVLIEQGVGRVVSNTASITVTTSAPKTVARSGMEASITIQRRDKRVVASITNHYDRVRVINKHFGSSAPFAVGHWIWEADGKTERIPQETEPNGSWGDFDAKLLVEVPPGGTLDLASLGIDKLVRRLEDAGADLNAAHGTIHFGYSNLCDRQWQMRQGGPLTDNANVPAVFRAVLPREVLSTTLNSNRIPVPSLK